MVSTQYKINKGIVFVKKDTEISLFDPDESLLFTLNETGAFIFRQLKTNPSMETLVLKVTQTYHISPQKAKKDIEELIEKLHKYHIITSE
jgi:hypothetical protein